jgi:hypothetical protein
MTAQSSAGILPASVAIAHRTAGAADLPVRPATLSAWEAAALTQANADEIASGSPTRPPQDEPSGMRPSMSRQ